MIRYILITITICFACPVWADDVSVPIQNPASAVSAPQENSQPPKTATGSTQELAQSSAAPDQVLEQAKPIEPPIRVNLTDDLKVIPLPDAVPGGIVEIHVNMGNGTRIFTDKASADAYVKEMLAKNPPANANTEMSRAYQSKADAEALEQKIKGDESLRQEIEKAKNEGYIIRINNVEYGRPDVFAARDEDRSWQYIDSQGILYGFGGKNGTHATMDQYYQGLIQAYSQALEENKKRTSEMLATTTPGERRINEPAFAEADAMWLNAIQEAEAEYRKQSLKLKKTVPLDYELLTEGKGKLPPDWEERRGPEIEVTGFDATIAAGKGAALPCLNTERELVAAPDGGKANSFIRPGSSLITMSGDVITPGRPKARLKRMGLSDMYAEKAVVTKVEDKVDKRSMAREKKKIEEEIKKKIEESKSKVAPVLVSSMKGEL